MIRQRLLRTISAAVAALWLMGSAPPETKETNDDTTLEKAVAFWQMGNFFHHMRQYKTAVELFSKSIATRPTAEGHTYLGWSLSMLGRYEEAIGECKKAIPIDPDFGNPYNDIGVYLIALGRPDEAIPWLEKAMAAKRYCCHQFPHINLGRIYLGQGRLKKARRAFERALQYDPTYAPALKGLDVVRQILNNTL